LPPGTEWDNTENRRDDLKKAKFVMPPRQWIVAAARPGVTVKTFDNNAIGGVVNIANGAGVMLILNAIKQGALQGQRIARRLHMKRLRYKGSFAPEAVASVQPVTILYGILYDRYPNGTQPLFKDVFNTPGATGSSPQCCLNPIWDSRFWVVERKQLNLPYWTAGTGGYTTYQPMDNVNTTCLMKGSLDLSLLATVFNATNGVFWTSINTGALWFFAGCSGVTNSLWGFNLVWQLDYVDE